MKKQNLLTMIGMLFFIIFQNCTSNDNPNRIETIEFQSNVATEWNKIILETAIAEDNLLTLKGVRTASMVHIAEFDKLLSKYIDDIEEGDKKNSGQVLGEASATAVLELRKDDAYNGNADYTLHPMAPGVYAEFNEHSGTPEGFVFGAGWAAAKPFVPPPPEINSQSYTDAFDEVKAVGRFDSEIRTEDQTHLAFWWKEFVESSHNALLRDLVTKEKLNLWQAVRSYALVNMAIYDAYVNVFDNKFHYNHWRPYTAIRWAENDENSDTQPDLEWNNLHKHTYPFPSYPSRRK